MLTLHYNGEEIPTGRDFSVRMEWVNPVCFLDSIPGNAGLGIDIPVNDYSRTIFGNPHRFENHSSGSDRSFPGFEVRFGGVLLMSGSLNITNATINQTGKLSKCYSFDGSDDRCYSGNTSLFNGLSAISISLWLYSDFDTSINGVIHDLVNCGNESTGYKFTLQIEFGGFKCYRLTVRNESYANRYASSGYYSLSTGYWFHLVATWDVNQNNGIPMIFKNTVDNTVLTNTYGTMTSFGSTSLPVGIGAGSGNYNYFNGKLDQVAIWNRALTVNEIAQLYNSGNGKAYSTW